MIIDTVIRVLNYIFAASVPFTHIGGYIAGIIGFFLATKYWDRIRSEKIVVMLKVFIIYGFLRNVFSLDQQAGFGAMIGYFSHWALPFVLGYALVDYASFRKVFWTYYGTFTVLVFVSVLAYFGLFFKDLGHDLYLVNEGLLKALRSHIALASLCLLFSFLSAGQALFRENLPQKKRILFIALALFFLAAIVLTGSRGYYIGTAASYSLFALFWLIRTKQWSRLGAVACGLCAIIVTLYIVSPAVRGRVHRTCPADPNITERLSLYHVALWEISAKPLTGFGPGQGIKQTQFFERLPENMRNVQRHPALHSFYLNFTADFGLVGTGIFLILLYFMFKDIWAVFRSGDNFTSAVAFGLFWGLIGILFGEMFDTLLRGPGVAMEVFWLAGLLLRQYRETLISKKELNT